MSLKLPYYFANNPMGLFTKLYGTYPWSATFFNGFLFWGNDAEKVSKICFYVAYKRINGDRYDQSNEYGARADGKADVYNLFLGKPLAAPHCKFDPLIVFASTIH